MTSEPLNFRIANQQDAVKLQQLIESAFRAEDSRQGWVGSSDLASRFHIEVKDISAVIINPATAFLVASDDYGAILGSIGVSKRALDRARLFMLAVEPQHHRGGIGRQVLAYAEDYCQRTWDSKIVELNALSTREALISWYLRRGYRKTGDSAPFPSEEYDDLALPADMCFIEFEKTMVPLPVAEIVI
ncbi:Acyl-CoA N-acyltransferase [Penicillium canariense]|uniref:Acyl-CoA N-acyltransferase n=1 Tax=Penicillium canariense TaxID=189055 RepID=A0A9W9LT20_9EURO|nr:Acyl-CoA N-acyltransferase [Penicillium canariense]KAJ5175668.1 Acyl-CoA N-acyltransferase [Penicillium canariense]